MCQWVNITKTKLSKNLLQCNYLVTDFLSFLELKKWIVMLRFLCSSFTVCPWFFQPQPKSPWTFSLLLYIYTYNSSKSVEKTICHRASKIYYCKHGWKCQKHASFSIENLFFVDYLFGKDPQSPLAAYAYCTDL